MTASFYTSGLEGLLNGTIRLHYTYPYLALVEDGYVFDASHVTLADLSPYCGDDYGDQGEIEGLEYEDYWDLSQRSNPIMNVTFTDGVLDADDVILPDVTAGKDIIGIVLFKLANGPDSACPLIAYIDIAPFTTDGGYVTVVWDNGDDKIFRYSVE